MLWIITMLVLVNLVGCYAVGHEFHSPQQHRQALTHLHEPNGPFDN